MSAETPPTNGEYWFKVPNALVDNACGLSHLAFRVYLVLMRFTRGRTRTCWIGIETIGEHCRGVKRKQVRTAIRELEAAGLVDKKERSGTTHLFTLLDAQGGSEVNRGSETNRGSKTNREGVQKRTGRGFKNEPLKRHTEKEISKKTSRALRFKPEDIQTALWIVDRIRKDEPDFKKPNLDKWANEIRLIREKHGPQHDQIRELFDWSQQDGNWKWPSIILSPASLRKHWRSLAKQQPQGNRNGTSNQNGRVHQRTFSGSSR